MTNYSYLSRDSVLPLIEKWHKQKYKIGFTSGAFDIIHPGHIVYLNKAKTLCDRFVVGVNSDSSIRKYKNLKRPIVGEKNRLTVVAGLRAVDAVFLFSESNNKNNILEIKPDLYIKGGDYDETSLTSAKYLESWGGKVIRVDFEKGYSTSSLIEIILTKYHDELPQMININPPNKCRVIFLDRDGVINQEIEYLHKPKDFILFPDVIKTLKRFVHAGFKLVVVTNQAGIGLGYFTKEDFFKVNKKMLSIFSQNKIVIDKIYYCPHSLGENCSCRKPGTLLLEKATQELNISLTDSFFIGDKTSDILAGKKMGVKTILVKTGHYKEDKEYEVTSDFLANNLTEAGDWILNQN